MASKLLRLVTRPVCARALTSQAGSSHSTARLRLTVRVGLIHSTRQISYTRSYFQDLKMTETVPTYDGIEPYETGKLSVTDLHTL